MYGNGVTAQDVLGMAGNGVANLARDVLGVAGNGVTAREVLGMAGNDVADLARDRPVMAKWSATALGGAGLDQDRMVERHGKVGWSGAGPDATVIPYLEMYDNINTGLFGDSYNK